MPKSQRSSKQSYNDQSSMSNPVLSLLARGNNAVLNSGNIDYVTAEDWAISREMNAIASDKRVVKATESLHDFSKSSSNNDEKRNNSVSVSKYLKSLSESKGDALDIVAALEQNATENYRRKHLTISELLKEARKEQPIKQTNRPCGTPSSPSSSSSSIFMDQMNTSKNRKRQIPNSSSSSSFFETSDLDIDQYERTGSGNSTYRKDLPLNSSASSATTTTLQRSLSQGRWADNVDIDDQRINHKRGDADEDVRSMHRKGSIGNLLSSTMPSQSSTKPSPVNSSTTMKFNKTISSFPKLPELDAVSPRTRKRLSRLPKPSVTEVAKIAEIEEMIQRANVSLPPKLKKKKKYDDDDDDEVDNQDIKEDVNATEHNVDKTKEEKGGGVEKLSLYSTMVTPSTQPSATRSKKQQLKDTKLQSGVIYATTDHSTNVSLLSPSSKSTSPSPPPPQQSSPSQSPSLMRSISKSKALSEMEKPSQNKETQLNETNKKVIAPTSLTPTQEQYRQSMILAKKEHKDEQIMNHESENKKRIKKEGINKMKKSLSHHSVSKTPPISAMASNKKEHVDGVIHEIENLRSLLGMEKLISTPPSDIISLKKKKTTTTMKKNSMKMLHNDDDDDKVNVGTEDAVNDDFKNGKNRSRSPQVGNHKEEDVDNDKEEDEEEEEEGKEEEQAKIAKRAEQGRRESTISGNHGLRAATDDIPIEVIRKSKAGQIMLKHRAVEMLNNMIGDSSGGYVNRIMEKRFNIWKHFTQQIKDFEVQKQLQNVKKFAYKWIAYTEIKVRKRLLKESKARDLSILNALRRRRDYAALLIQRKFRGHSSLVAVKLLRREKDAAILLQNTERRYLARKELEKRRREYAIKVKAVILVQTKVRVIQARYKVRTLLKIKKANELLAAKKSRTQEARTGFAIVGAAITLQRFYRTSNYWAIARAFIELKKRERTERIRNWIRRWKAVILLRQLKKQKARREAARIAAAVTIQAYMRRWLAEYELGRLIDEKEVRRRVNVLWKQHIFGDQNDPMKPRHVFRRTPKSQRKKNAPPEIVYGVQDYPGLAAKALITSTSKLASETSATLASNFAPYDATLNSIKSMLATIRKGRQERAAITLNRVYRGHKARVRCKWDALMKRANDRLLLFQKKTNLALKLQSRYRGNKERKYLAHLRVRSKIVTLQVLVRAKLAQRFTSHLRMQVGAATTIQAFWRGFKCHKEYKKFLRMNVFRIPHAISVQAHVRMRQAKRRVKIIREDKRREIEKYSAALCSIDALRARCARNLLVQASYDKEGVKYRYKSLLNVSNGKAIDKKKTSSKDPKRDKEKSKDDNLFKGTIQEMFTHWCVTVRPPGTDDQLTDNKFMKMLLEAKLVDDKVLKRSDCDLIFASQKEAKCKTINFTQFITAMDVIAVTLFEDVREYPEDGHKKSRLRGRKARHAKLFLDHLLLTKTNKQFHRYLMRHTDYVLAASCRPVQGLARKRGAAAYMLSLRAAAEQLRLQSLMNQSATTIASKLFRKYKGRCEGLRLARGFIVKMVDPTLPDDPFWFSRVSSRSSWTKPWVFGPTHDATKEVHLPPKGSEYTVMCVHCSVEKATIACEDCGEAFCKADYDTLHLKGNRRAHRTVDIPNCFRCGFQTASRFCETCRRVGAEREREGEAGAYGKGCGNYCDHCFGASHPKLMAQDPTKSITKRLYDAEAMLQKMKIKRQIFRKEQRARRRKEIERCRKLGLMTETKNDHDDFDFDQYIEEEEEEKRVKEQEAMLALEQERTKNQRSPMMQSMRKKSTLIDEVDKATATSMMTPEALELAQQEKEASALVAAIKEEKHNLAIRLKEEDRMLDEKLLPLRHLRKEVLEEVEGRTLSGAEGPPAPKRRMPSELLNSKIHRPAWLVVPCVECKGLAARWRCEQCNDIFCRACFDFIHARGLKQTHAPVVALSWYTPFMNKKFEELCLVNTRRRALQSMAAAAARKRDHTRHTSAIIIQKTYRGVLDRRVGIPKLKRLRGALREAWRLRENDEDMRSSYVYQTLNLVGLAPKLPSDTIEERALLRLPAWKRYAAKLAIQRNAEESVFFCDRPMVCPQKDPKKKKFIGFDVKGITEADLAMQAWRSARRLPGTATIEFGSRFLFVTHPLMGERPEPENEDPALLATMKRSSSKDSIRLGSSGGSRPGSKDSMRGGGSRQNSKDNLNDGLGEGKEDGGGDTNSKASSKKSKSNRNEKKQVVLGDEAFTIRSDILYLFSEKREYYTPEDEILQNNNFKLTTTANPVCVRRKGTKKDFKKEVKLHKSMQTVSDELKEKKLKEEKEEEEKKKKENKTEMGDENKGAEDIEKTQTDLGAMGTSPLIIDDDGAGSVESYDDDVSLDGSGGGGSGGGALKAKLRQEKIDRERLKNKGKYMIELKFPWMNKSLYNVPILCAVPAKNTMKRLPWLGWEFRWMFMNGPIGQLGVQTRVDILEMVVSKYRDEYIPKLEENPTSRTNQNLIRLMKWRIKEKDKYAGKLKLLLRKPRKGAAKKKELTKKANELENLAGGTSMADVQAAKDKRKESAYMDDGDKGPAWVEEIDPASGGTFWKNTTTGEISLEDPSNRAKTMAELSPEERKHQIAMDKFKIQKEKDKEAAKKKNRGKGRR